MASAAAGSGTPKSNNIFIPSPDKIRNLNLPGIQFPETDTVFQVEKFAFREIEGKPGLYSVTIPKGTLFYHAAQIPYDEENQLQFLIRLLKGLSPYGTKARVEGDTIRIDGCLDKTNLRYLFPCVLPAIDFTSQSYIIEYELRKNIDLVVLMTPSKYHKQLNEAQFATELRVSSGKNIEEIPPLPELKSCTGMFKEMDKSTLCPGARIQEFHGYDKCFEASFLQENGFSGHIAISGEESGDARFNKYINKTDDRLPEEIRNLKARMGYGTFSVDRIPQMIYGSKTAYREIVGPTETVLHQFGTEGITTPQPFSYTIDIEDGNPERTLIQHLLLGSETFHPLLKITSLIFWDKVIDFQKNIQGPLYTYKDEHILFSYNTKDYNIPRKIMRQQPSRRLPMFVNYINKFTNIESDIFVDPRTGFLIRSSSAPTMSDGTSYMDFCFKKNEPVSFSDSVRLRLEDIYDGVKLVHKELHPELHIFRGGKRKTRRRMRKGNGKGKRSRLTRK